MTLTTTKQSFPKPEATEPPNGPAQIGALADDLDLKWPVRSKGKSIISAQQGVDHTTGPAGFVYLGTPDRVQNIVLPTDGLIFVLFQAEFRFGRDGITGTPQSSVGLYLGSNVPGQADNVANAANYVVWGGTSGTAIGSALWSALSIGNKGVNVQAPSSGNYSHNANGQAVGDKTNGGGPLALFAPAGTYEVGVKFDASATNASLQAKNRKLWVWTMEF